MSSFRTGRTIRTPEGYLAFVPPPLPPELTWTPRLARVLSDADRSLGRLAGEGARLPNPHLLLRPFIRREAALLRELRICGVLLTENCVPSTATSRHF